MARSKRSVERERSWRVLVEEQRRCGVSIRAFCGRKAISEPSFYAWQGGLRKRDAQRAADAACNVRLIPVDVVDPAREHGARGSLRAAPLEIAAPGGFTLRFDHDTAPSKRRRAFRSKKLAFCQF
jgi:hypothetical protein